MKKAINLTLVYELVFELREEIASLKAIIKPLRVDKLLSYKEAAEQLNISIEGLKTRIKRGQMKRTVNGNKSGVLASEIKRYLREQNLEE